MASREALNSVDPEGLIELGAPLDEYDREAGDLVRLVMRDGVTRTAVAAIWQKWFGSAEEDYVRRRLDALTEALRELHSHYGMPTSFHVAQTLWDSHREREFPSEATDETVGGHDLVLLEADAAGYIATALGSRGANEHLWRAGLDECISELHSVVAAAEGDVRNYYASLLQGSRGSQRVTARTGGFVGVPGIRR